MRVAVALPIPCLESLYARSTAFLSLGDETKDAKKTGKGVRKGGLGLKTPLSLIF